MHDVHDVVLELRELDLGLLVSLDVLVRTRSVTVAAEQVGITQSAMSHALRRLRDRLGDPLLVRAGSGMALTPRAEALAVPLRTALVDLHRAVVDPPRFDPRSAQRSFRLCSPDLFDVLLLPDLLARLRSCAPGVSIAVVPGPRQLASDLATGDLDLAIVPVPEGAVPDGRGDVVRQTLFHDSFRCFVRDDHPALVHGALSLDAFVGASHAMVSPTGSGPGVVDVALASIGRRRHVALRLPSFASAPRIVARSDLILTAPSSLARVLDGVPLVCVPSPIPLPGHGVAMLWHRRFQAEPGHRWLRDLVRGVASNAMRP